jgi:predicted Rossmann-fold nucleotide-binding protein
VLTWAQLGLHAKPIVVLNTDGYWTPLKALIDHVIAQGFADPSLDGFVTWADTPEEVMGHLRATLG